MKKIYLLIILCNIAINLFAWSQTGHRIIGEVASNHISKKTKRAITKILGSESIAIASNWADFIKADPSMKQYDAWHYINFKAGLSFTEFDAFLNGNTNVDAFTKINFLITELKKPTEDVMQKRMYLRILIHLVGDIHQPLHVGKLEDLGGNKIKVLWFNDTTNLHSVWDGSLIDMQKLSFTEYTKSINFSSKKQIKEWQKQSLNEVFYDSYTMAQKVYAGITQPYQKLSYRYNFDNVEMLNIQLLKGGIRLAGILNEIFG